MKITVWVTCLFVCCPLATRADNSPFCTPPIHIPDNQPPRPSLPAQFEVHVECNFLNLNTTTEVHEFYDDAVNRGEIRQRDFGVSLLAYYNFDTNELLEILPDTETCVVQDLKKNPQRYVFGYNRTVGGTGHIFSAYGALHFGETNTRELYQGRDTVRGIQVEKWYSCLYWAHMDATMNVTWYFSDPLSWDTALGVLSVPVRAHVLGVRTKKDETSGFEHYYEFMHFKPAIEDMKVFETPHSISCPGRKNTKPLPTVATAYSFTNEIVDNTREKISFIKESYDELMKVTKFEYKPSRTLPSQFGYHPLTEIHDFNTGVAYIIDPLIGNCTYRPIEGHVFDDVTASDPHQVRIRTAKEFFSLDSDAVTYEGVKTARNIDCDTWVGRRDTYRGQQVNSTWQWYFKKDTWTAVQERVSSFSEAAPVRLSLDIPQMSISYMYNIYNYIQSRPNLLNFDITPCFMNLKRRKFDFQLPTDSRDLIEQDRGLFKYSVLMSLSAYTQVFPLRVSGIKIVYDDHIHVRFELLDVRPVVGDVTATYTETPLDTAAQNFVSKLNNNQFVIYVMQPGVGIKDTPYVVAVPHSVREYTYESELSEYTGYTPGALGGVAAAMVVVGGALGGGLSYAFFK